MLAFFRPKRAQANNLCRVPAAVRIPCPTWLIGMVQLEEWQLSVKVDRVAEKYKIQFP
jgi:hypothetical protein